MSRTINEERGARRAEDLRRRFRHVSDVSFRSASGSRSWQGQRHPGRNPATAPAGVQRLRARRSQMTDFLTWCVLAVIVATIGLVVFI
ncbi:hypothetical protein [Labrenzia sp. 011]|uniref:hypothetical protein n=1 Tax=Labrenzia sp. 011 TaxID=2171494 RepID=UPI000D510310|nr:hypothetical protein [Labrenzia sp. 011]PVB62451.1 hypothetical protein DCO57_06770 [Labrenzia sp. 011]